MKGVQEKKKVTRVIHRSSGLKTVARSIGNLNYGSVARQVMKVDIRC